MRKKYIWGSIDEIPFNLDPRKLGEYDISHLDYPEVHPNLIPYVDNSFYLNLIKQGVEPFEFEYITFINAMTHNLIEYDGKVLKTYCVENYSLSDDDDERDRIWYDTLDNEALPEEFYEFIESNKNYPGDIQNNNVPKMFHQSLGDDKSNISNDNDTSIDDEVLSYHKFSQENLDSLKKDKNTKLQILKDIFTDIDFPDYANEEWYLALAHQKSVAKLDYYWEGILPDYPNVAKTLANNHHINKKLLSDVRNFGKKLEKVEETKKIGYAIEDLVFANPIFIELRFEIFSDGRDFFEEFYEPEKRRNTYFPLFLKNPGLPEDILEILELKYNYESARDHINYSEKLIIKTLQNKDLSITDKFSFIYSDKCSEKILDALLNSEKNSNNKSNFFSSGRLRKAIALHEKTSSNTVNNLLKDEISWVRKAAATKSILNKKEIDEILKIANQKFPAKSFKFKIKSSYGYGLVEDVGGEVGIDDVVEAILSGEEWDTFIRDEYYSYDSEWHEHGPTTLADIIEYEDGTEEEIDIDGKYNHEHFGEVKIGGDALGKMEFFQIATSWEKGEWEYEEFELYDGFEPNFLKAIYQDECSTEGLVQKYSYNNPESDKDNDIEIYGEFLESRTSGTDIDLYVNTQNEGLQYFDSLSDIVDEMEEKGLDAKNEKVVHEFLIEKYFKEIAD